MCICVYICMYEYMYICLNLIKVKRLWIRVYMF